MTYRNLLLEESEGIVLLTLNRPKALNALNRRSMEELEYFFGADAPGRDGLRGVILTGAGDKAFVAGADIAELLENDPAEGAGLARRGQEVFFLIERFHCPVIAAVNGFALGGGCELAMACHLRIAGEHARFGQPEVKLGLIPGYGGTQRLVHYLGKTKALELILGGDMIDAGEAHRLGLVNEVVPSGKEVARSREWLEKTRGMGPYAMARAIEAVNAAFEPGVDGFAREVELFGKCIATHDFREGASAFLEKRKPDFKGE